MAEDHEYGNNFRKSGRPAMEGIIAIDPAGPIFEDNDKLLLNKKDAKVVQVLHTDTDTLGYRD